MKIIRYAVRLVCISIIVVYFTYIEKIPDDMNVIKVKCAVGSDLYYRGAVRGEDVTTYRFQFHTDGSDEALQQVIVRSQEAIEPDGGKCTLEYYLQELFGQNIVLQLLNYRGGEVSEGFDNMCIRGSRQQKPWRDAYDMAQNYTVLPDIRYLAVTEQIDRDAQACGVDWFEVWDTLESYEVIE